MPTTIPYDSSLVLGQIVCQERLDKVKAISEAQAPVNDAERKLNSYMATKRSLDMTRTELLNLGFSTKDVEELDKSLDDLKKDLVTAAAELVKAKVEAEKNISQIHPEGTKAEGSMESPVDYVQTAIKSMPLAADSISMDVQYFSADTNRQGSKTLAESVGVFVSKRTEWMGTKASVEASAASQKQVSEQTEKHDISGTLVFSVSCTHKNASLLAPFVLHVDKAIKVWNSVHSDDPFDPTKASDVMEIAKKAPGEDAKKISIISGTTFGSSFVGMVHILRTSSTTVKEDLSSYTGTLQTAMEKGCWFANTSGGFGVDASLASQVKNLLSEQNITSHVTMTCMGVIPTVVASDVKLAVKQFSKFDPASSMEAVATIQNATNANQGSLKQSAEASRTGGKMLAFRANDIKSALSAVSEIDDGANKILDINSMMTALDDYLKKAAEGNCGVPLNYYIKDITKDMLAEMWVAKYYPGQYMAIKYDDSEGAGPARGGGAAADSASAET